MIDDTGRRIGEGQPRSQRPDACMPEAVEIEERQGETVLALAGRVAVDRIEALDRSLKAWRGGGSVVVDLSNVDVLDTAGAWLVVTLVQRLEGEGATVRVEGASETQRQLLDRVTASLPAEHAPEERARGLLPWLERIGRGTATIGGLVLELLSFLGETIARLVGVLIRPWRLRGTSLVAQMHEAGFNAVPIVVLMTFLIGIVLGYQGAAQLRQFGAEVFVVDLIAISILRELGVLLTAIVVAGRSASAFTSSIGSMKMQEEIDAMRTLGLDPVEVLVVPRVLALLIMLPVLAFLGNMSGLLGGMIMSWIELGISPALFVVRLLDGTDVNHFLVGMVKAPVFAIIIAVVGAYQGMKVEMDAASLGRRTSVSVVLAIFLVIVFNALFSIFFAIIGI
jgi:phospholipid/cholesterol/gamma-HCH transport system permease protein